MKAKTRFNKMYQKLPMEAKTELVMFANWSETRSLMSLSIIRLEINGNTVLGKKLLKRLGYEDD